MLRVYTLQISVIRSSCERVIMHKIRSLTIFYKLLAQLD